MICHPAAPDSKAGKAKVQWQGGLGEGRRRTHKAEYGGQGRASAQKHAPSPDGKDRAQIEHALDVLLTKLLAERKRQREAQPTQLRVFSAAELAEMPIRSDREISREQIIEDPLAGALELAIGEIGEVLFQQGGVD